MIKRLSRAENQSEQLSTHLNEQRRMVEDLRQTLNEIERNVDGFVLKDTIEEKHLQKEELKVKETEKINEKKNSFRFRFGKEIVRQ